MAESKEPNWRKLVANPFWVENVVPVVMVLKEMAVTALLDVQATPTIDDLRFLQGKAAAYAELLNEPKRLADLRVLENTNRMARGLDPLEEEE